MRKIIKLIITIYGFTEMFFYFIQTVFLQKNEEIWIFSERGYEAKDNAYYFYNYVTSNYKNIISYYVIDKKSSDIYKFKNKDNIIQYKSKEHKKLFFRSNKVITTHIVQSFPWDWYLLYPIYNKFFKHKIPQKLIWLQHGIMINDLSPYLNTMSKILDLMITSTSSEYNFIINSGKYLFKKKQVTLTGLARFDNLDNNSLKDQILVMPTWRIYLSSVSKDKFIKTDFFKMYMSFLSNNKLLDIIDIHNHQLIFYLHYRFQKYIQCFEDIKRDNIKIVSMENTDVQQMIKESRLLITDYSSVFFDFAYLKKPTIHYQFDQQEFRSSHYNKGYFDYYSDAFGPILLTEDEVVEKIAYYYNENFCVEKEYLTRRERTFEFFDKNNCARIFTAINKI